MKDLGVGIVGCGVISTIYMQNLASFRGVRLVACADILEEPARIAGRANSACARSRSTRCCADPEVDMVVNLTTPNAHFEVSHAALTAGKHVFSEKPLCVTAEDGHRLVAGSEPARTETRLRAGHVPRRRRPAGPRDGRWRQGRIGPGRPCSLMSHGMEHWHPNPSFFFKPGGGPILDMGPYYLAALCNLLGPGRKRAGEDVDRIRRARGHRRGTAQGQPHRGRDADHASWRSFVSCRGADIVFSMSWDVWKHGHPPIELYGTEGSLPGAGPELLRRHGGNHRTRRRLAVAGFVEPALRQAELAIAGLARQRAGSGELSLSRDRGSRQRRSAWNAASLLRRLRRPCAGSHARDPASRRRWGHDQDRLAHRTAGGLVGRGGGVLLARLKNDPERQVAACRKDYAQKNKRLNRRKCDVSDD